MPIKAIVFDHDGTLVDSETLHFKAWCQVLAPYDLSFSQQEYCQHHLGLATIANAKRIIDDHHLGLDPHNLASIKEAMTQHLLSQAPAPLMPGALDCVRHCRALGLRLAIATGANRQELARTLQAHFSKVGFEATACKDDVVHTKPEPDVYLNVLARMELSPEQALAVEDSKQGILAAKAAGLVAIAIKGIYGESQDFSAADHVCDDFRQVQDVIRSYCPT